MMNWLRIKIASILKTCLFFDTNTAESKRLLIVTSLLNQISKDEQGDIIPIHTIVVKRRKKYIDTKKNWEAIKVCCYRKEHRNILTMLSDWCASFWNVIYKMKVGGLRALELICIWGPQPRGLLLDVIPLFVT